jgi:hypothetical protein
LRSGGASTAANKGVSEILLKAHGRWLSDRAKDGYIKDNLQSQMSTQLYLYLTYIFKGENPLSNEKKYI